MDSILNTIKKMLGLDSSYTAFDNDLIIFINGVFMTLNQIGIGPTGGFFIEGSNAVWSDFLGETSTLEAVKTYIFLKVKLMFDPPTTSAVLDSMYRQAEEQESRLKIQAEFPPT